MIYKNNLRKPHRKFLTKCEQLSLRPKGFKGLIHSKIDIVGTIYREHASCTHSLPGLGYMLYPSTA
jgi:hypothetical protein